MINLLPPKEKEELRLENNIKLVIVLGNIFIISLICLSLVLFSLKFYILTRVSSQDYELLEAEKKYKTPDFISLKQIIQQSNETIIKVDNFYKKDNHIWGTLETILELQRPSGVYFTSIVINRKKEDAKHKVSIYGASDNRDNLLIFKNNIERNEQIENLNFPASNWLKPNNIDFSLTFETK